MAKAGAQANGQPVRIAICAPGKPLERARASQVQALADQRGMVQLRFAEQCFEQTGHFAGEDSARLAALVDAANDPDIDCIWFASGGYGSARIAAQAIAQMNDNAKAKYFMGYSDTGNVLAGLYRAGMGRPVHGPMVTDIGHNRGEAAIHRALDFLCGEAGAGLEPHLATLNGAPVVAFNLMTLAMLSGSDLMPDLSDHVVMVEEVGEHLYAIDRLFFHISNNLPQIAGLRLGRVSQVPENDRPFGQDVAQIAQYWCDKAGIPFLGEADIGHDVDNKIVPFGLVASLASQ